MEDKLLAFLLAVLLTVGVLLTGCGGPKTKGEEDTEPPSNVAEAAAASIDESSIRTGLAHLTGASPAPLESGATTIADRGSEDGRRAAAEYMKESFEAMGIPARIIEFTSDDGRGFNVEATLQGTEGEKHLWVSAHLDSFFNAGANDDASGLVSILLTARALKQLNPKHTVHFVAYDLEEVGLDGSTLYVGSTVSDIREQEGDQAIIGNLHSDMIGYDEGDADVVAMTCDRADPIDEAILRASEMIDSPIKINLDDDCRNYSDHKHFWDLDLPAVLMIDSEEGGYYPWSHDPADTMDKLNIPYLRSTIQLNAAAIALLVTAPESES